MLIAFKDFMENDKKQYKFLYKSLKSRIEQKHGINVNKSKTRKCFCMQNTTPPKNVEI
jgi:hypothetical protein